MRSHCRDCKQPIGDDGTPDSLCIYCDDDRIYGVGDQRCSLCNGPWRRGRCMENCALQEKAQKRIDNALKWFGMSKTSEVDICENGQVYVGLTEILPRNSMSLQ